MNTLKIINTSLFSILCIGFIAYAATSITSITQTATTGDVVTSTWVNTVNSKLKQDCGAGKYLQGFDANGTIICATIPAARVWEDVPLSDTNYFDPNCEYKIIVGTTEYKASFVYSTYIGLILTTFDASTILNLKGIAYNAKSSMYYHQSSFNNNTIYSNIAVTALKKRCN